MRLFCHSRDKKGLRLNDAFGSRGTLGRIGGLLTVGDDVGGERDERIHAGDIPLEEEKNLECEGLRFSKHSVHVAYCAHNKLGK